MGFLDEQYWSDRYHTGSTGWDIGFASPPITQYLDQLANKDVKILIPGAGNAYEAAYAFSQGFTNVHVLDLSVRPLIDFKNHNPLFPQNQLINTDFFDHEGEYELVLEQTFFCALDPTLREAYCQKMKELIKPNGKLVGLLFDKKFPFDGPPFGGKKSEYLQLFKSHFSSGIIEPCYNSIPERMGAEAWINWVV